MIRIIHLLELLTDCAKFKSDKIKIDKEFHYVRINEQIINFGEIDYVTAKKVQVKTPDGQVDVINNKKYYYFSALTFYLKNNSTINCRLSDKYILFDTLKKISPYVKIDTEIDYKNQFAMDGWLFIAIILIAAYIFWFIILCFSGFTL